MSLSTCVHVVCIEPEALFRSSGFRHWVIIVYDQRTTLLKRYCLADVLKVVGALLVSLPCEVTRCVSCLVLTEWWSLTSRV